MTSILNISARKDSNKYKPTVINNINVNSKLDRVIHMHDNCKKSKEEDTKVRYRSLADDDNEKTILRKREISNLTEDNIKTENDDIVIVDNTSEDKIDEDKITEQDVRENVLFNKIAVLESYIDILQDQQEIKHARIICTLSNLRKIIAASLDISVEDIDIRLSDDVGCFTSSLHSVESIIVNKDQQQKEYSLNYPDEYTYLRLLKIDTSHVFNCE